MQKEQGVMVKCSKATITKAQKHQGARRMMVGQQGMNSQV
jgi:hypothetical protein